MKDTAAASSSSGTSDDAFRAFQHLVPVVLTEDDEVFSSRSFGSIKQNTLQTLYNSGKKDKSPKGSVDVAIRPLVDLINYHPSYATLSSCSGRITLFDPNKSITQKEVNKENIDEDTSTFTGTIQAAASTPVSGKGRGGWLLSSHEEVEPTVLETLLAPEENTAEHDSSPLIFKHEPMLLHVAACNMESARKLLNLALQIGFRESGIVLGASGKMTVAIRGVGTALTVPLARSGALLPPKPFLQILTKQANERMRLNQDKLQQLFNTIQETLFEPIQQQSDKTCCIRATVDLIPPLKLWGHASVAILSNKSDDEVQIYVFGGYGTGPEIVNSRTNNTNKKATGCRRSNNVYRLTRNASGVWEVCWKQVAISKRTDKEETVIVISGVETRLVDFAAREGLAACVFENMHGEVLVTLWGGRAGPASPCSSELILFEIDEENSFATPFHTMGKAPSPRWGHALTSISKDRSLLTGGCNKHGIIEDDSVYLLTLVCPDNDYNYFKWERINETPPLSRFHHATVANNSDSVFIFGGLEDPNNLGESFSSSDKGIIEPVSMYSLDIDECTLKKCDLDSSIVDIHMPSLFGASSCSVTLVDGNKNRRHDVVVVSGGVAAVGPMNDSQDDSEPLHCFGIATSENVSNQEARLEPYKAVIVSGNDSEDDIDFGSMVHHVAVPLPSTGVESAEMLLLGGGVLSFAFGASFAKNYRIQFSFSNEESAVNHFVEANKKKNAVRNEGNKMQPPPSSSKGPGKAKKSRVTNVIYVSPRNAKSFKTLLEEEGFLDKTFRMTKSANGSGTIAVPITDECLQRIAEPVESDWKKFVVGTAQQEVPYSTVVLGSYKNHM